MNPDNNPYRPLVGETPRETQLRELLNEAEGDLDRALALARRQLDALNNLRRESQSMRARGDAAFALAAGVTVMFIVVLVQPLFAAWWSAW